MIVEFVSTAALGAIIIAFVVLIENINAWLQVAEGQATSRSLMQLTGCQRENEFVMRFGHKNGDGLWNTPITDVFAMQNKRAEVTADPVMNILLITLLLVALKSQFLFLLFPATIFAVVWLWDRLPSEIEE